MQAGWTELALLALATNVDNLAVGAAYGVRNRRVTPAQNAAIACANAAATAAAMAAGHALGDWLGGVWGVALGAATFTALGAAAWIDTARARPRPLGTPDAAATLHFFRVADEGAPRRPAAERIPWREAGALAFALSVSNLATGVGAGAADWPVAPLAALMWFASFAGIAAGLLAGARLTSVVPIRHAGYCGAALLLALAARAWWAVASA